MAAARKPQDRKPKATETETTRIVTVDGIEVSVNLALIGSPRTIDDLGVMQEAAEAEEAGAVDPELAAEAALRLPALLRRLVGYPGSRKVHATLESRHGAEYSLGHTVQFVVNMMKAVAPN